MTLVQSAAVAAAALLGIVIAFQLALAAGAPWGKMAYGGRSAQRDGRLDARHRVASAVAAVILTGAAWAVLAAASLADAGPVSGRTLTVATWTLAVLLVLNTVANLAGRHPLERWGAGTVTALLAVLCVVVTVGD